MVILIDGTSEKGVYARSNICYLICLGHSIRSSAESHIVSFISEKTFLHACATCSEFSFYIRPCLLYFLCLCWNSGWGFDSKVPNWVNLKRFEKRSSTKDLLSRFTSSIHWRLQK